MNYKYLFLGLMFLLSISFVNAQEIICLNPVQPNITCMMVTPTISCVTYTYEVYDENTTLIDNGIMNIFINDTYFFNFTQNVGTYYIKICDGSTRQINVVGDTMIGFTADTWLFVTLVLMFVLFIFLAFKLTPIFLALDGIIMFYFAYYSYGIYSSWVVTSILALVGMILIFFGVIGALYKDK